MKPFFLLLGAVAATAAEPPPNRNTYARAYGETRGTVVVDPAQELPRFPAVDPAQAVATWKIKTGFRLELAAHEPAVRSPVAICFDERGRMFVAEMIDYSEERERTPHLGRISCLEDRDGDGVFETSTIFADNLPWPTGLIWAQGALFVGATPDIWRFEDRDGDGRAEVREKVFTGFGTGLPRLNVQALLNSFQWGQDHRIHVQSGSGNRGRIKSLRRPELPEEELGARDFWFDPRTFEFGFEAGGAQYGMSFDNWGRKFASSNSDHLQFWVFDERYATRNPFHRPPPARQSVAADGGAAEVFRLSPDEPWRIIRTRLRVGGVWQGPIEGGGRVSGYFTGATGTTVYRGDAYGEDFVGNTFTGDAGGQLIHRKKIFAEGVSVTGRRPEDERGFEFAASTDTWVRPVNFANAPDGCLYVCDMYREIIEHPWSLPEEIKKHLDLNSGSDRGRIYRIVPTDSKWQRRKNTDLTAADAATLVATLAHPNGWHRDTAARLLGERRDPAAPAALEKLLRESDSALARHHALGVLAQLGASGEAVVAAALADRDARVRERAIVLAEKLAEAGELAPRIIDALASLGGDNDERVRLQLAFTLQVLLEKIREPGRAPLSAAHARLVLRDAAHPWISAALLSGPPALVLRETFPVVARDRTLPTAVPAFVARVVELAASVKPEGGYEPLVVFVTGRQGSPLFLRAFCEGLRRANVRIAVTDGFNRIDGAFDRASFLATNAKAPLPARLEALDAMRFAAPSMALDAFVASLAAGQPPELQAVAVKGLAERTDAAATAALVRSWRALSPEARTAAFTALLTRDERVAALLDAVAAGTLSVEDFSGPQAQAVARFKNAALAARAKSLLGAAIPATRAEVLEKYQPAAALRGEAARGHTQFVGRCSTCHRAGGEGQALGPDLVTVKNRGREGLLVAIVDPHREVAPQYIAYDVTTKDGAAYAGLITRDDASGLALRVLGGAEVQLPRANIKTTASAGRSLMPEGLEYGMTTQDMADLLTFIEELK